MHLEVCKPEATLEAQLDHCGSEFEELVQALAMYRNNQTMKHRAEVLFEALDNITCLWTFIAMEFSKAEIEAGVEFTNKKNFVRHYLLDMSDLEGGSEKWG